MASYPDGAQEVGVIVDTDGKPNALNLADISEGLEVPLHSYPRYRAGAPTLEGVIHAFTDEVPELDRVRMSNLLAIYWGILHSRLTDAVDVILMRSGPATRRYRLPADPFRPLSENSLLAEQARRQAHPDQEPGERVRPELMLENDLRRRVKGRPSEGVVIGQLYEPKSAEIQGVDEIDGDDSAADEPAPMLASPARQLPPHYLPPRSRVL